jgi:beta-glucosidase
MEKTMQRQPIFRFLFRKTKAMPFIKRFFFWFFIFPIVLSACKPGKLTDPEAVIVRKTDSILSIMTLEEKAGQMLNIGLPALLKGDFYSPRDTLIFDEEKVERLLVRYGAGSVQNLGFYPLSTEEWKYYISYIQKTAEEKTRLKIPILYGIDAVHGANYTAGSILFPHQINLAATFDTSFARKTGEIAAYEVRASRTPWNYAPMLDVARNPLWGRVFETFGEDSYVVQEMGSAVLLGMQGASPIAFDKVVACGKHFLAYGAPANGKDRSPVTISEQMLRQIHLPPFQKAIEKGLLSVMLSAGSVNGIPTHADHWLITDLLKGELGFKGVVVGDWGEIDNLYAVHKIAADEREAVKISVLAGIDICMEPYDESFAVHLVDLVRSGEIPESRVDDAVRRILYLKYKTGIFDDPLFSSFSYPAFASDASQETSLQIARESITLLKNKDQTLPLSSEKKIFVTGVAGNSLTYLNGGWSRTWGGEDTSFNDKGKLTILEAVRKEAGESRVKFSQGTGYLDEINIEEAVRQARQCDIIIACVGEKPATEKPSDIEDLELPDVQLKLVRQLAETGKPIVLVLVQGRPRIIREIEPLADAILMAYLPGNEGGKAVADVIFGKVNPSGRLPYTWPRYSGSVWTYDHPLSDERDANFGLNGFNPQFEFGDGLSYSRFEYGNISLSTDTVGCSDTLEIEIPLSNAGDREGKETSLLFLSDEIASVSPPVKQLKRFVKTLLIPGQTETLGFILTSNDLKFVGRNNQWKAEEGYFTISIGGKTARFYYKPERN